jgi:hypothetical protein
MAEKLWGHCPDMGVEYENRYTPGEIVRVCMAGRIIDICTRETCPRREQIEKMMEEKDGNVG